jgi:hypothetical protein
MLWEERILSEFLKLMQGVVEVCFGLVLKTIRNKMGVGSDVF